MVVIRVEPHVPAIPQAIELFPGPTSGYYEPRDVEEDRRRRGLFAWLRSELQREEVVLVFCHGPATARSLLGDSELASAVAAAGGGEIGAFLADAESKDDERNAYW